MKSLIGFETTVMGTKNVYGEHGWAGSAHAARESNKFDDLFVFVMVALYGIGHTIIFSCYDLFFLLLLLSFFPRLISAATDWMSDILPHMVWP